MFDPAYILVDGSSYLFRSYYVPQLKRMQSASGQPTGAVFGTLNMLKSLENEYPQAKIVPIFDAKGKTFRHDMYHEYKAHRPPMPDDLASQIPYLHKAIRALGFPLVSEQGVEADDVIGTYAQQASQAGRNVLIASGDKDLAQLVDNHIRIIDTMKKKIFDSVGIVEKFGVRPEQMIDYLALVGDSADNIPGVSKVGPKTAVKWLSTYGSLDSILKHAEEIKGVVGQNLRDSGEQLPLSKSLVTLRCDVALRTPLEKVAKSGLARDELVAIYSELSFNKWLNDLGEAPSAQPTQHHTQEFKRGEYEIVLDEQRLATWVQRLRNSEGFAFDTETTSLSTQEAELVGVSFAVDCGQAAYVPLAHDYDGAPRQLSRDFVLSELKGLLENASMPKIGQNLKYDQGVLAKYNIDMAGIAFDTMLESYVLNSVATRHDMDSLSLKYLGHQTIGFTEIAGKGKAQKTFNEIELETAGEYAAEDADITLRLHHALMPRLTCQPALHRIFNEIEMPLVTVLSRMEARGVLVDIAMLQQQSESLFIKMEQISDEAFSLAGQPFNLSSPKQIQEILYEEMQLPVLGKTPSGAPSTAEDVMIELARDHELPRLILQHRGLGKLKSTYTDKLPKMISPHSGRVHTSYHQAVAATGRLSSSDPNLQNIPIRSEEGRRVRDAFIAPKSHCLIAADYSQIELRIMAHLSQDEALLSAFQREMDIHRATASQIFDTPLDAVNDEQRRHAKAVNFGLMYGMSAFGLGKQLGISRQKAQSYIDQYFNQYPGVQQFMQEIRESARALGYVETLCGRRLYLPDIKAKNHNVRQYAERTAINAPMQGTAADIIKLAMIEVDKQLSEKQLSSKMIMQVHDELVLEVENGEADGVIQLLRDTMESVVDLDVPLTVDIGQGQNWSKAH